MVTAAALELGSYSDTTGSCIRDQMRDLDALFRSAWSGPFGSASCLGTRTRSRWRASARDDEGLAVLHRGCGDIRAVMRAKRTMMQILRAPH